MSEDNTEKKSILKRIFIWPLHHPLTALCLLAIIYFAFQAYILDNNPAMNKLVIVAIIVAWGILFILKHLIVLIMLVLLGCGIFYAYYQYTNRPRIECEEKGGIWNEDSQTCEEKSGIMAEFQKFINKCKKYIKYTGK
ncbi:MAG: hypothetical protein E7012_06260 [Alphaproteobacteria bacterium]|nr:hypothetical protein [Alphaproteobacteria bacterium]